MLIERPELVGLPGPEYVAYIDARKPRQSIQKPDDFKAALMVSSSIIEKGTTAMTSVPRYISEIGRAHV